MSTAVMTSHVWLDERGVAWLDDTNIKVLEVAMEQLARGSSAEEIYEQHRGYLSLAGDEGHPEEGVGCGFVLA